MDFIEQVKALTEVDIGPLTEIFAVFVMILIQSIKPLVSSIGKYTPLVSLVFAVGFGVILTDWSTGWNLGILSTVFYTVAIASSASGIYSWVKNVKKEEKVEVVELDTIEY